MVNEVREDIYTAMVTAVDQATLHRSTHARERNQDHDHDHDQDRDEDEDTDSDSDSDAKTDMEFNAINAYLPHDQECSAYNYS